MREGPVLRRYRREPPVPVARLRRKGTLSFEAVGEWRDRPLRVPAFEWARDLRTRQRVSEDEDTLPASVLARGPVLLKLSSPGEFGERFALARPRAVPSSWSRSLYGRPRLVRSGRALLVPGLRAKRSGARTGRISPAPLTDGVWKLPAGLGSVYTLSVPGGYQRFEYDPYHGTLLVTGEDGEPLSTQASVEVVMNPGPSPLLGRAGLVRLPDGDPAGMLRAEVPFEVEDARRAAAPEDAWQETQALGHAQLGGAPYPKELLFEAFTSASEEELARAVRHTLPAGSLVRRRDQPQDQ